MECPSSLEPHGRSIVESCGGLPLAIVAIAGVVSRKKRLESEWLGVKESIHWHLTRYRTKIMDVLKLSYDSLSEELKPCFRYLGIYPEDFKIPAGELIQLWMAEGFLQPKESRLPNVPEPEIVGEEYLKELVDRNMVVVVSKRKSDGGVKECLIHDLFRDLCIILSKADNETSSKSSLETNQSSTRSLFLMFEKIYSKDVLKNFQSVQVLHLGRRTRIQDWSFNFEAMTFIKYLRVNICGSREFLCRSIWSLSNLETIDILCFDRTYIPNEFWKLRQLRRVYLGIGRLILRTDENETIMWNLQTLYSVSLDTTAAFLFRNRRFPNLRKLALWLDTHAKKSCWWHELLLSLHHLSNVRKLKLHCCNSDFSLHAKMFPSNLAKITFLICKMSCSSMKALGQLPNLQVLKLVDGTIQESLDCATGDFPKLQVFKMMYVSVESWMLAKGAMPALRYLLEISELHSTSLMVPAKSA
ncbi:hypothetical protein PIB30_032248 [Stylosanthes scabra]|uniref:NB-ARC domain-containing protein n=1 Tax=Stylosanthes scabra TaxID=79078 RepID=A0ABU6VAX6_9FABA|nr:hypothetical protein [Stylosanthes scabra]